MLYPLLSVFSFDFHASLHITIIDDSDANSDAIDPKVANYKLL